MEGRQQGRDQNPTFHKCQSGVTVLLFCQRLKVICQGAKLINREWQKEVHTVDTFPQGTQKHTYTGCNVAFYTCTHTDTHVTDRPEWRQEKGLSWVVSRHDAELCFWTWAIFQRGYGGHLVSFPLWPPLPPRRRLNFPRKSARTQVCQGSSNKIYRWGHKTPGIRGGRQWCSTTQSQVSHRSS